MTPEIDLLQRAKDEINGLRHRNEIMRARLDMFDSIMTIFRTEPQRNSQGMSPDIAFEIEKFIQADKSK